MEMSKGGYSVIKPEIQDLSPKDFIKLINFSSTAAVMIRIRVGTAIGWTTTEINVTKTSCRYMANNLSPGETIRVETLLGYEIVTILTDY
ncbi:MAG: hypothetical protein CMF17_11760 [Idiomarinaceae bacterium]|nr:hypothetical protein [Idiomarinaceae bacterium]